MNITRIEEIALDCIVETVNDSPYWVFSPAEFNRFAEQIKQECISMAQSYPSQNEEYAAGIDSVRDKIKEFFGVKE